MLTQKVSLALHAHGDHKPAVEGAVITPVPLQELSGAVTGVGVEAVVAGRAGWSAGPSAKVDPVNNNPAARVATMLLVMTSALVDSNSPNAPALISLGKGQRARSSRPYGVYRPAVC